MNWKIEIKPSAEKAYLKLDKKTRQWIKKALGELESSSNPFLHPNVRGLTGKLGGDYRFRVGPWRILFTPKKPSMTLYVYAILPRKDSY
ncbi:MAG: type II toxin-antitoxin system RelE/ParE family toxin [Desulfobacterota bacterium]|nr:type II toxin-antitoxin system RelE/ParE family toxin [Thermodesulfobacteriota bacterium]